MDDVFTYLIDLPPKINEAVTPCLDGYTIYINRNLSKDKQIKAYLHALHHIMNCDFERSNVQQIESEAHNQGDIQGYHKYNHSQ